ncbi:hypothetical protein BJY00DRAFT_102361 [Aspergillus carlsbadensis]|nr:hypothetical protein BJY00DRAFT_102361 [Aspergillus carlsbadensis]
MLQPIESSQNKPFKMALFLSLLIVKISANLQSIRCTFRMIGSLYDLYQAV